MKKMNKLVWIMILLMFIPAIIWFLYEFASIFISGAFNHFILLMLALMVYEAIIMIIMIPKIGVAAKERRDNIISTKPKRRFKYIDSIWYEDITGVEDSSSMTVVYHIIQEIDTDTIYAINSSYTNKVWHDIPFQKEGSFWIEKEVQNHFYHNGERMEIGKKNIKAIELKNEHKWIWENRDNIVLHHGNEKCDIVQLLEQAKFITGVVEFDAN